MLNLNNSVSKDIKAAIEKSAISVSHKYQIINERMEHVFIISMKPGDTLAIVVSNETEEYLTAKNAVVVIKRWMIHEASNECDYKCIFSGNLPVKHQSDNTWVNIDWDWFVMFLRNYDKF